MFNNQHSPNTSQVFCDRLLVHLTMLFSVLAYSLKTISPRQLFAHFTRKTPGPLSVICVSNMSHVTISETAVNHSGARRSVIAISRHGVAVGFPESSAQHCKSRVFAASAGERLCAGKLPHFPLSDYLSLGVGKHEARQLRLEALSGVDDTVLDLHLRGICRHRGVVRPLATDRRVMSIRV